MIGSRLFFPGNPDEDSVITTERSWDKIKTESGYLNRKFSTIWSLLYAISVHKSQGSEFDYVYIVVPHKESHLLSMELLYTAITRAQKKVTIFLQQDISTLTTLSRAEKSAVRKINSKTV